MTNHNQHFILSAFIALLLFCSCSEDDVITPISDAYVNIVTPYEYESKIPDSDIQFRAEVVSSDDINYENLTATWTSDKDGILYENQLSSDGFSNFSSSNLSHNIHNIRVSVKNEADSTLVDDIELYNVLKLNSLEKKENSLNISWTVSGDVDFESFTLYRSLFDEGILNQDPIIVIDDINQTSYEDVEALLGKRHHYRVVLKTNSSQTIASNIESSFVGTFFRTDYPLSKIVYDAQRQKAYALVNTESIFDDNDTGFGLLFIDLVNFRVEKRILDNLRFSDLDIGPNGNYLYVANGNAVRKINLDSQTPEQIYFLNSPAHKIEVGNNDRLYYHITPPSSGSTEFRMYDLANATDIPYGDTMTDAERGFRHGDFEIDPTNTIFHGESNSIGSRLSKLSTTNDIFSLEDQWDSNKLQRPRLIYNNGLLYWNHFKLDTNLNVLGTFEDEYGDIDVYDVSPNGIYVLARLNLFYSQNESIYKRIPAQFDNGFFVGNDKVLIYDNENPISNEYNSTVILYDFE